MGALLTLSQGRLSHTWLRVTDRARIRGWPSGPGRQHVGEAGSTEVAGTSLGRGAGPAGQGPTWPLEKAPAAGLGAARSGRLEFPRSVATWRGLGVGSPAHGRAPPSLGVSQGLGSGGHGVAGRPAHHHFSLAPAPKGRGLARDGSSVGTAVESRTIAGAQGPGPGPLPRGPSVLIPPLRLRVRPGGPHTAFLTKSRDPARGGRQSPLPPRWD